MSNVDSPVGHNLSRVFSKAVVGSLRRGEEGEEEAEQEDNQADGEEIAIKPEKVKETYAVSGSLCVLEEHELNQAQKALPGPMIYTGDKKKDLARKDAIEKLAVLGQKPKWVENVVPVIQNQYVEKNIDQQLLVLTPPPLFKNDDKEKLKETLLNSDIIVYDLLRNLDEAVWAAESKQYVSISTPKTFFHIYFI